MEFYRRRFSTVVCNYSTKQNLCVVGQNWRLQLEYAVALHSSDAMEKLADFLQSCHTVSMGYQIGTTREYLYWNLKRFPLLYIKITFPMPTLARISSQSESSSLRNCLPRKTPFPCETDQTSHRRLLKATSWGQLQGSQPTYCSLLFPRLDSASSKCLS
jgi:hypothetical protein